MRSRLPLRGIAVFEAAARLGSFKAAAAELNLTPSAVSHQIRMLEDELGVELFRRMNRGVRLPSDAAGYAALLHSLFEQMRRATDDIAAQDRGGGAKAAVRIMTPPSLATHWLMPRLPAFLDEHPGLDIRVYAVNTADGNVDDFDIVIGYGNEARWQGRATPLLEETTQPYCAPVRLKGASSWTAQKLLAQPLIRSRGNAVSWEAWFRHQDLEAGALAINPIQIDPSYVAIEAAVKGVGVILESSLLTQEHVDAGRLVAPLPEGGPRHTSYWLLPLRRNAREPTVKAYRWLTGQANLPNTSPPAPRTRLVR